MAEKDNAVCAICGKGYHKCLSCKDKMAAAPWKLHCCSAEHYKIYQILHGNTVGVFTNAEAKKRLKRVDLSDLSELREDKQAKINELLGVVDKPVAEVVVKPEPVVVVEDVIEPVVEPVVEETAEANVIEEVVEIENTSSDFVAYRRRK